MISNLRRITAELPKPVRIFWALNVFLSLSCLAIMLCDKYLLHGSYPYTFPTLPFDNFDDFVCFDDRFKHFHNEMFFSPRFGVPFAYPAPMTLFYKVFDLRPHHHLSIFLLVNGAGVLWLAYALGHAMIGRGLRARTTWLLLFSTLCVSYPLWFELVLANLEICVFLVVGAGMIAFLKERFYLAASIFAVAASMKIFPFVYLALLMARKKYRELAFGIAVVPVLNLVALWALCPSIGVAYRGLAAGFDSFRIHYALAFRPMETGFDHSLFGFIKRVAALFHVYAMPPRVLTAYLIATSVFGLALYFVRIRKLPFLNQALCLCIVSILLPPTSHDYTLLHLYIPWGLVVLCAIDRWKAGHSVDGLKWVFACFAILFSAESELIFHSGFSGQFKAVTLVLLLVIALKHPWRSHWDDGLYEEERARVVARSKLAESSIRSYA